MTDDHDPEPRLPRLTAADVPESTRELFERFRKARGNVPNLFRVAAHRPAIAETLEAHMRAVMGPGEVPVLLKELISVRVSHMNLCDY